MHGRMFLGGPTHLLNREERRELATGEHRRRITIPTGNAAPAGPRCLFCLGPLANGRAVCSDECDDGWWEICPTIDGELWE